MDNDPKNVEEIARLTGYTMGGGVSRIHSKRGTFHIVRDAEGVKTEDTSLDEVASAPRRDPGEEASEDPKNFLGEINVGVSRKR